MKCPVCKNGQMEVKNIDYQAKFKDEYVVVKNVTADVCNICGETFLSYETVEKIEDLIKSKKAPKEYVEVPVYDLAV